MSFFNYEPDMNAYFDMYTGMHLLMLGLFVLYIVLFFVFKNKIYNSKYEKQIRYGFAGLLAVNQVILIIMDAVAGKIYIPLHLCTISFILTIVLLITNNKKIFTFVFFTGIIGGLVSFAIPDLEHAGYTRFKFYEFIIAHGAIILVPLYYLTNYKFKITKKGFLYTMITVNVVGFLMLPVNMLIRAVYDPEANYMFSYGPPEDVEGVLGKFPIHFLSFELILLVTFFGLYLLAQKYQKKTD